MLPFQTAHICFSMVNNDVFEGYKWQNALLSLLLPNEVKQQALTGSHGPESSLNLTMHILHLGMCCSLVRHKFRINKQENDSKKIPLSRIFLYFRKKQMGFAPLPAPQVGALSTSQLTLQSLLS